MGAFVLAPLIRYLEDYSGWRGVNIILAGFCLQCAVFGATMRPLQTKYTSNQENSLTTEETKPVISVRKSLKIIFQDKSFLFLMLANPPAVMGHYLVYVFLPGVSGVITKEQYKLGIIPI